MNPNGGHRKCFAKIGRILKPDKTLCKIANVVKSNAGKHNQYVCYALCYFGPHANKSDADENNTAGILILERMNEGREVYYEQ